DPAAIDQAVQEATCAIAAADSLEELKAVRAAHQGDKSPLALANRGIGSLPSSQKAEVGKRVGKARGLVAAALKERRQQLEDERDARILIEEAVDVTMVPGRRPLGRRHPVELMGERMADLM